MGRIYRHSAHLKRIVKVAVDHKNIWLGARQYLPLDATRPIYPPETFIRYTLPLELFNPCVICCYVSAQFDCESQQTKVISYAEFSQFFALQVMAGSENCCDLKLCIWFRVYLRYTQCLCMRISEIANIGIFVYTIYRMFIYSDADKIEIALM